MISEKLGGGCKVINVGEPVGGWNDPTEYVVSHVLFWYFGNAQVC